MEGAMLTRVLLVAGLLNLATAAVLTAQSDQAAAYRNGFWIGFGVAGGHAHLNCSTCDGLDGTDPWSGGAGMGLYVAMGGTPRPNLLIGGEVNVYSRWSGATDREANLGNVALVVQYYPMDRSRFHVKGGAGFGYYYLVDYYYLDSFMGRTSSGLEGSGFGVQAGIGYDVLLTSRFALVPYATMVQLFTQADRDGAVTGAPKNPRYVQLGIGFQWY
jgi:hypothetical protein